MFQFKYYLARAAMPFMRNNILAKELHSFINKENTILLDVRTEEEWEEYHIPNSIHIDYYSDTFFRDLKALDKNKEYVVYCKAGVRSAGAVIYMKMLSFPNTINVQDGICSFFTDKEL
ncbi:MAG: rhodanese-like domain-containing protein [Desulfovibrionaceae bacterium]